MENKKYILEDSIRNTFMGVVWSHKIQEKQADIYLKQYSTFSIINIAAASLTSVGILALIFENCMAIKVISGILALITVFFSIFFEKFHLLEMSERNKNTAKKLLVERDNLKLLLMQLKMEDDEKDIKTRYEKIVKRIDDIYLEAPNTSDKAVRRAQKALNVEKDNTFTVEEIDACLPETFRRGGK